MKLGKGRYVYQVYCDNRIPEEAEVIKWLEPLARRRQASEQILRILIQVRCGGASVFRMAAPVSYAEEETAEDMPPLVQLSLDDLQQYVAESDIVDGWSESFRFGS